MDLFCNTDLVNKISKSSTMTVNCKATLPGYKKRVWYDTNTITDIQSLQHLIEQYWVTYESINRMFVGHREPEGKANMQFKMHSRGLHYFDPQDSSSNQDFPERETKTNDHKAPDEAAPDAAPPDKTRVEEPTILPTEAEDPVQLPKSESKTLY